MDKRINLYNKLSYELLLNSDEQIKNRLKQTKTDDVKRWGETGITTIANKKVFYKKIPLAQLYYENNLDTSNLYDVPAYYNYGYGSAGINPWRELITHINLSNWVIQGETKNFPILYHWRVIQDNDKHFELGLTDKLLSRFGNNPNIKKYLEARANCEYKIILFLEYIPNVLYKYIESNPNYLSQYIKESTNILNFLSKKGILDLDAHWGNYLVDNDSNLYLTDFGLVLDKHFKLDADEKKFMKLNLQIPYYYSIESIYSFVHYYSLTFDEIKELFSDEIKKKLGKINYVITFIKSLKYINKIIKLPNLYVKLIQKNKNKIIKLVQLKINLENSKDKNVYLIN